MNEKAHVVVKDIYQDDGDVKVAFPKLGPVGASLHDVDGHTVLDLPIARLAPHVLEGAHQFAVPAIVLRQDDPDQRRVEITAPESGRTDLITVDTAMREVGVAVCSHFLRDDPAHLSLEVIPGDRIKAGVSVLD